MYKLPVWVIVALSNANHSSINELNYLIESLARDLTVFILHINIYIYIYNICIEDGRQLQSQSVTERG